MGGMEIDAQDLDGVKDCLEFWGQHYREDGIFSKNFILQILYLV